MTRRVAIVLGILALAGVTLTAQSPAPDAAGQQALVDLNTASAAQLQALPGIGVRIAERIIEYREANGGFERIEELMNVQGIAERTFLRLRPLITVTPPGSERASSSSPSR